MSRISDAAEFFGEDPVDTDTVTAWASEPAILPSNSQGTTVVIVTSIQSMTTSSRIAIDSSTTTDSPTLTTSGITSNESATSSEGTDSTKAGGPSAGVSAGIGIGVALGVLLLAFVVFILYRRKRKHRGLARGNDDNRPALPELGTDGQKHELSAEECRRAELSADEPKRNNANVQELE
ncbi:hypothetical protein PENCOP_c002G08490 [Penicillium coprophilum]|uniref:Mid2 domain-containing protein n=1 Tax=Penicillium coprophilum TaxID=36646 RepID=A0A1V6V2I6_9EURO|nr:hypothetical protein PENCOP_c002G08490 [Penicillium coprophilum]